MKFFSLSASFGKKTKYTVIKTLFSYEKWHVAKILQFAVFILQEIKDWY
jgi:type III secretory pathway component EscS